MKKNNTEINPPFLMREKIKNQNSREQTVKMLAFQKIDANNISKFYD